MILFLGELLLFAAARVAAYVLLSWCLGARCCCGCRSLAVLAMVCLGNFISFAAAVAAYLLPWYGLGAYFCCLLLSFICCLGAVLVLSTAVAAAAVHLLSLSW
ncbi:hypothetical protein MAM1_0157d06830 [Mucor ambiguus]|uniref:Uncharacterized protein n=1 Tax=Mucor ambiguus TaxID=91626 RepID=A0A0C9MIW7_9FUNG|nr:hypothetical protein MAM1_0157d06830 [Mucor ambiguus]